jgi:hypothetical protein
LLELTDAERGCISGDTYNTHILRQVIGDMNDTRAADDWLRTHPTVWLVALALVTGSVYGVHQLGFGESTEFAVAGGIAWGVFWTGSFIAFCRLLSG